MRGFFISMISRARIFLGALALICCAAPARAHFWAPIDANVTFKLDGTYEIDFVCDVDALLVGQHGGHMPEEYYEILMQATPEEIAGWLKEIEAPFHRTIRVRFDDQVVDFAVSFPELGKWKQAREGGEKLPGRIARFSGKIPEGAKTFTFWVSRAFGAVNLRVMREGSEDVYQEMVEMTVESKPCPVATKAPVPPRGEVAAQYLRLGFEHILPEGLDHILFVLGLFLLGSKLKPLLLQVTAFTAAHTVTVALSMLGAVRLPPAVIEPLIAVSIAYVAVENVATPELKPWRPAVVFAFGLLHGLGFAGALKDLGIPSERFITALLTFNLGVEGGQIAVLVAAFAAVGIFRGRDWYRARLAIPCSCAIAVVALYWTVERIIFFSKGS